MDLDLKTSSGSGSGSESVGEKCALSPSAKPADAGENPVASQPRTVVRRARYTLSTIVAAVKLIAYLPHREARNLSGVNREIREHLLHREEAYLFDDLTLRQALEDLQFIAPTGRERIERYLSEIAGPMLISSRDIDAVLGRACAIPAVHIQVLKDIDNLKVMWGCLPGKFDAFLWQTNPYPIKTLEDAYTTVFGYPPLKPLKYEHITQITEKIRQEALAQVRTRMKAGGSDRQLASLTEADRAQLQESLKLPSYWRHMELQENLAHGAAWKPGGSVSRLIELGYASEPIQRMQEAIEDAQFATDDGGIQLETFFALLENLPELAEVLAPLAELSELNAFFNGAEVAHRAEGFHRFLATNTFAPLFREAPRHVQDESAQRERAADILRARMAAELAEAGDEAEVADAGHKAEVAEKKPASADSVAHPLDRWEFHLDKKVLPTNSGAKAPAIEYTYFARSADRQRRLDLTPAQWHVLRALKQQPRGLTHKDLRKLLGGTQVFGTGEEYSRNLDGYIDEALKALSAKGIVAETGGRLVHFVDRWMIRCDDALPADGVERSFSHVTTAEARRRPIGDVPQELRRVVRHFRTDGEDGTGEALAHVRHAEPRDGQALAFHHRHSGPAPHEHVWMVEDSAGITFYVARFNMNEPADAARRAEQDAVTQAHLHEWYANNFRRAA